LYAYPYTHTSLYSFGVEFGIEQREVAHAAPLGRKQPLRMMR
jgi:hypothetical protein